MHLRSGSIWKHGANTRHHTHNGNRNTQYTNINKITALESTSAFVLRLNCCDIFIGFYVARCRELQNLLTLKAPNTINCVWLIVYWNDWDASLTNSVDPDQTAPLGAVWSWSTLLPLYSNQSIMLANKCSRRHKQTAFFRGIFVGALRVKPGSTLFASILKSDNYVSKYMQQTAKQMAVLLAL